MLPRARQNQAEDGFILIEVLVSALILAIVAGAVLTLITATTHSAASERTHSVAFGLAQEDQARLRSMRLSSLNEKDEPNETTIGGTKYLVRSQGRFVNNSSGTRSCSSGNASTDYVEITSTVSAATMPNSVSLHSIISPSNGSLDPSHGSLAIQATNGAGNPVSGVTATITGPTNGSASTKEEGCAIFADIPAGNYNVVTSANGLINREGQISETLNSVRVPPTGTQQVSVYYDRAGAIEPRFVYVEPGKTEPQTAAIDSMMVYNSEGGKPASMYGSPGTYPPTSALKVEKAYPFAATYSVYAGSCVKDLPEPSSSPAIGNIKVEPGATMTPTITVPALDLEVTYAGGKVVGAPVTVTDTQCPEVGTKVKRILYTNKVGHAALSESTEFEALGLPYGIYNICVSAKISGSYRSAKLTNFLVNETGTPTVKTLALTGNSSSSEC
jgi:Tfp pilus assembly protein PilV